jgi:hypothetical protein
LFGQFESHAVAFVNHRDKAGLLGHAARKRHATGWPTMQHWLVATATLSERRPGGGV